MWLWAFDATPIQAVRVRVKLSVFSLQRLFTLLQLSMSSILTHGYVINRTEGTRLFIGHIKTRSEKFGTLCLSHLSPVNLNPSAIWANESLTLSLSKPDFPWMFKGPRNARIFLLLLQMSFLKREWGSRRTSVINGLMKLNFRLFLFFSLHTLTLQMQLIQIIYYVPLKCWNSWKI